jgi:hypothetical protein
MPHLPPRHTNQHPNLTKPYYGQDRKLRAALERRRIPYVMAVPVDETVHTHGTGNLRVDAFAAAVPLLFERRSCGTGAKGLRSTTGHWPR